jgi:hypothetical protein
LGTGDDQADRRAPPAINRREQPLMECVGARLSRLVAAVVVAGILVVVVVVVVVVFVNKVGLLSQIDPHLHAGGLVQKQTHTIYGPNCIYLRISHAGGLVQKKDP